MNRWLYKGIVAVGERGRSRAGWALLVGIAVLALSTPVPASASAKPTVSVVKVVAKKNGVKVVGKVTPPRSGRFVKAQIRVASKKKSAKKAKWRSLGRKVRVRSGGRFSILVRSPSSKYRFRIIVLSKGRKVATSSESVVRAPGKGAPGNRVPVVRRSSLDSGATLASGGELVSPNGRFRLVMQPGDGNLVLYEGQKAHWWTGAYGGGTRAVMQTDGNFVVYNGTTAKWNSQTTGFAGARLVLQNDGNLVIYRGWQPVWAYGQGFIGNRLTPGATLVPGAMLRSPNGRYRLLMQPGDGNLVLYEGQKAHWWTGAYGGGTRAVMQTDGNFVVYNGTTAKWNSQTTGFDDARLELQNDGNLVIYRNGIPIWSYGQGYIGNRLLAGQTLGPGAHLRSANRRFSLEMQRGDGNLVLYEGRKALWNTGPGGAGTWAIMQGDGNFVTYGSGVARWHSVTAGYTGSHLVVQNDGNLVIYQGATPIWDRNRGKLVGGGSASTPKALIAANWAAAQMGQTVISSEAKQLLPAMRDTYWSGNCIGLTVAAWKKAGVSVKYADAKVVYAHYKNSLKQGMPPRGAIVFWPNVSKWGHVAIADGRGGVYTTVGVPGERRANTPKSGYGSWGQPAGWLMPG